MHLQALWRVPTSDLRRWANRRGWPSAALLVGIVLALAGCGLFEPTHTYRYRMTVEVNTPEGLRIGIAVREFSWRRQPQFATSNEFIYEQRGEAVAVELPGERLLFALLDTNPQTTILNGFHAEDRPSDVPRVGSLLERAKASGAIYAFPMEGGEDLARMPRLVTFRNIDSPTSVELVDPDNIAATFGKDYALKRITVAITDGPVTTGVEARLGWLKGIGLERGTLVEKPPRLLKDSTSRELVSPGDFATELWK